MPRGSTAKEIGEQKKQRILALVAERPMSGRELAQRIHLSISGLLIHTKQMMRETPRRLRIASYEPTGSGKPTPMYGPGDAPDVVYEPTVIRKPKQPDRVEARMGQLIELLEQGPFTVEQIASQMNLSCSRARGYVRQAREIGWVYIAGWIPPNGRGDLAPAYALGLKADKPKPRQTRAQRFQKEKRNVEQYARSLANRRHLYMRAKLKTKPNGIFGALGI